jgi:DNA polymerase-3 subunit alpha
VKKYAKKDNRPWVAFTLATRKSTIALNMFADAFAAYGTALSENAPVLVQGNIIRGADGPRVNVKECYALDAPVCRTCARSPGSCGPATPGPRAVPAQAARDDREASRATRGWSSPSSWRAAWRPVAEASAALSWRLTAPAFQELRSHPASPGSGSRQGRSS